MVTLTAPANHLGAMFLGWRLGGGETGLSTGNGHLVPGTTLTVPVWTLTTVEAIYGANAPAIPGRRR